MRRDWCTKNSSRRETRILNSVVIHTHTVSQKSEFSLFNIIKEGSPLSNANVLLTTSCKHRMQLVLVLVRWQCDSQKEPTVQHASEKKMAEIPVVTKFGN
jgi:hypothetical protein